MTLFVESLLTLLLFYCGGFCLGAILWRRSRG